MLVFRGPVPPSLAMALTRCAEHLTRPEGVMRAVVQTCEGVNRRWGRCPGATWGDVIGSAAVAVGLPRLPTRRCAQELKECSLPNYVPHYLPSEVDTEHVGCPIVPYAFLIIPGAGLRTGKDLGRNATWLARPRMRRDALRCTAALVSAWAPAHCSSVPLLPMQVGTSSKG